MANIDGLDYDEISFERKENEKYEAMKGPDFEEVLGRSKLIGKLLKKVSKSCLSIDRERDIILDAFALLGGNENLVSQILDRLQDTSFR